MNLEELKAIQQKVLDRKATKKRVCVCAGAGCMSSGAQGVLDEFKKTVKEKGLDESVEVIPTGCMGACNQGPLVWLAKMGTSPSRWS